MAVKKKRKTAPAPMFDTGIRRVGVQGAAALYTVSDGLQLEGQAGELDRKRASQAFVRVRPAAGASKELLEGVVQQLTDWGAKAVRVLPVATAPSLPAPSTPTVTPNLPTRVMLLELVDKSASKRKQALRELIEKLADEEGL